LLEFDTFFRLNQNPGRLREELKGYQGIVVIDEIQKLPILLGEVQIMIEDQKLHFLLTGSSARKLKRSGVNLLGGRARTVRMHPLTTSELADKFDLMHALNFGTLPAIYFSEDPALDLKAYAGQYLKEEIAAEGLTRNVPAFSRFLETAALCNGQIINYQAISSDAAVPRTTVQEYFSILKDTLIAEDVESWRKPGSERLLRPANFIFLMLVLQITSSTREGLKRNQNFSARLSRRSCFKNWLRIVTTARKAVYITGDQKIVTKWILFWMTS
jgi:predicted AAA+ superfamily ATPase